ncbi:DUF1501 domain-containing protein [Sphingomonas turrisvirgatae]|uniref:Tat pathway signal protein n=1 Tax=Sphingomonas turrisvirgatae TaxID=1888892 RepID=A0A1E3LRX8_9SPHN|nr:DUF1501 domain-containing protein [Sphingomonas turrisvirgatae]ODP36507.1 Tat pathway signal protein [Sphingomonas turrisvirgatae]
MSQGQSRRAFLRRTAALGIAGGAAPFVTQLAAIGEASAAVANDYKAMVCLFMHGGNDYANTLPPYDAASHAKYLAARPTIGHARTALAGTALKPLNSLGGREYALSPALAPLLPMFDAGRLAVVLNVGTLIRPITKAEYQSSATAVPPKLFSHNDQQSFWQACGVEGTPSGWGGRIGDLLQSGNGNAALTCISAAGNAIYLSGRSAIQYVAGPTGPTPLLYNAKSIYGSNATASALRSIMSEAPAHLIAAEHAAVSKRALDLFDRVDGALGTVPDADFPLFPSGNGLANQLKMVARLIAASQALGAKRQVFFVSMGGFDMHDGLVSDHAARIGAVAAAMRAFHDTTASLGFSDKVTLFTASDFGRTLTENGDGSDHGWGSMHFVAGGAVKGQRIYGTPPAIGHNTPDDVGQGRLLPTIGVDQYAATLASWFGVGASDLPTVLPNAGNFSNLDLGFL